MYKTEPFGSQHQFVSKTSTYNFFRWPISTWSLLSGSAGCLGNWWMSFFTSNILGRRDVVGGKLRDLIFSIGFRSFSCRTV